MQSIKKPDASVDNDLINHLLFHKSIIDEESDASRINHYVEMLKKTDQGEHVSIDNPFDRSIAIAFELVMKQHLNPWEIDLVNFSTLYLERAEKEKIDLITAGRIIYMAWKVLKMQSDDLVVTMEEDDEEEDSYDPFDWEDLPSEMWLSEDDAYSYTNLVMETPEPPIEKPVRRKTKRKVSLIELLDAFNEARKEAEERKLSEERRKKAQKRMAEKARERMEDTTHEDNLEEDVNQVWQKIREHPNKTMTLNDICNEQNDRSEVIKFLLSILFLANDNKIQVYQKKFPYGKIFIKNKGYS
ncbi:MAG: segregation/condensation protein A [Candidatus Thermoplasmatota archaeon]